MSAATPFDIRSTVVFASTFRAYAIESTTRTSFSTRACHSRRASSRRGEEEALTGEERALEPADQAAGHPRVHLDALGHERHRARFGAHFVAGAERENDRLHVVADDFVTDHGRELYTRAMKRCPASSNGGTTAAGTDP